MRNLAKILPLKSKLSGKFQHFNIFKKTVLNMRFWSKFRDWPAMVGFIIGQPFEIWKKGIPRCIHCIESVRIRSFSGPHFLVSSPNAGKYGPENSKYGHVSRSMMLHRF